MFVKYQGGDYMNIQEFDIMNILYDKPYVNQRKLVNESGHSLGIVNRAIKSLIEKKYLDNNMKLTDMAKLEFESKKPKNAIILSAGFGMRMVPINLELPKAFLEVNGEILIERIIKQLKEVGIDEIYVVVGFMKEKFDYLIDEFNVKLVYNKDYTTKNNLYSLKPLLDKLNNTYVVHCDIWSEENPFNKNELYSWYMVNETLDKDSMVRVNRKNELVCVNENELGNQMLGVAYLLEKDCDFVKERVNKLTKRNKNENIYWETALINKNKMIVNARVEDSEKIVEIKTYEQLRELDEHSNNLKTDAIEIIEKQFNISKNEIYDIKVLKKGMTNRSFLFKVKDEKYIMRIPGEGTDELINRKEESEVYETIRDKDICDDIIYINSKNGYKITRYMENSRCCDADNDEDLRLCMDVLRKFHDMKLKVSHEFNIFEKIDFYESLWKEKKSIYKDYEKTKKKIKSLQKFIDENVEYKCLTHIDANPDNFLFEKDNDIRLIDWEYSAMQDPHIDIAMFCIYALYDKRQIDNLIDIYFKGNCDYKTRIKIYAYVASCGLLWSNWCEYKLQLGVEFGEYSLKQYRYAKDYYKIVEEMLNLKSNI